MDPCDFGVLLGIRTSGWRFGVSSGREVIIVGFAGDVEIGGESETLLIIVCGDCGVEAVRFVSRLNGDPSLGGRRTGEWTSNDAGCTFLL